MAKRTTPKKASKESIKIWNGFCNFYLTQTDKQNIKKAVEAGFDPVPYFEDLIEAGYSIKLNHDSYSDCFSVVVMGGAEAGGNVNWGMSARHTDLLTCIAASRYQHVDLSDLNGDWPKPSDITSEYDY